MGRSRHPYRDSRLISLHMPFRLAEVPTSSSKATIQKKDRKHVRRCTLDQEQIHDPVLSNVLVPTGGIRFHTHDVLVRVSIPSTDPFLLELRVLHILLRSLTNRRSTQK